MAADFQVTSNVYLVTKEFHSGFQLKRITIYSASYLSIIEEAQLQQTDLAAVMFSFHWAISTPQN